MIPTRPLARPPNLQVPMDVKELFHNLASKQKQDKAKQQKKKEERAEAEDLLNGGEKKKQRQLTFSECAERRKDEMVRVA